MRIAILFLLLFIELSGIAQQTVPMRRHFLNTLDSSEFVSVTPSGSGTEASYSLADRLQAIDIIDSNFVVYPLSSVLVLKTGQLVDGKREGIFRVFLIDSLDHHVHYKIGEIDFDHGEMSGESRLYTLVGTLFRVVKLKASTLEYVRNYAPDGVTLIQETDYENSPLNFVRKDYDKLGKVTKTVHFVNGVAQ